MKYQTISEIYEANARIRANLKSLLSKLTEEQLITLPEGEKWNVMQIVEHISLVADGTARICAKLLQKASVAGKASNGTIAMSENFLQKGSEIARIKVNAPDFVQPVNGQCIADSLAKLDEARKRMEELRPLFETVDGTEFKFPHPFFGDTSAQEWLVIAGGHEARHTKQIERLVERIGR